MDNEKKSSKQKPSDDNPYKQQEIDSALIKRLTVPAAKIVNNDELETTKKSLLRKILNAIGFNK